MIEHFQNKAVFAYSACLKARAQKHDTDALNLEYSTNATSFLLDNIVGLFEKGNLPSSPTQWHFNPREHLYFKLLNRFKDDFQGEFYAIRHHYSSLFQVFR